MVCAGRAMGLALLHGEVLPGAHFTPNFLKALLGQPGELDDLKGNPPVHTFLKQLLAGQLRWTTPPSASVCMSHSPVVICMSH